MPDKPIAPKDMLAAIVTWMKVREASGYAQDNPINSAQAFRIEASHSLRGGLLGRLVEGEQPLSEPPPLQYSRPWYKIELGFPLSIEPPANFNRPQLLVFAVGETMCIFQHGYEVVIAGFDSLSQREQYTVRCPNNNRLYLVTWNQTAEWFMRKLTDDESYIAEHEIQEIAGQ